jgi:uncharacterized protein YpuA (DUF1002 family)
MTKYYSIGELIDDNLRLKKKLEKIEKEHIKNIIFFIQASKDRSIDWDKVLEQLKQELDKI